METVDNNAILVQVLIGWTVVACMTGVLMARRTALLGFTLFAAFTILSASHSALLWTSLFGLDYQWVTPAHLKVFNYVGIGMVLFSFGILIAWKPLRISAKADPSGEGNPISGERAPAWLTPQFVLLCMCIGAAGYLLTPITSLIPTVHAIWTIFFDWLNAGILIAGFYSGVTRRYKVVLFAFGVFFPLALVRVVSSGHAGALGLFLVQFGVVFLIARKVRLGQLAVLAVLLMSLGPIARTWFRTRGFIREGALQGNLFQRVLTYGDLFRMYYEPFNFDPYDLREVLFLRIDMTQIFAAQVNYQPMNQPYAYGKTFTENILIMLVPRIIWKDKPVRFGGAEFVGRFTGMYKEDAEGSVSVGTPVNLEFYANFGPWGAMILLGVYGYCCARLELSLFNKNFRDLPKLLRQFVYTMVFCTMGTGMAMTIMKLLPGLVGVWVAGKVIEYLRRTMRFQKDFLTPLDPKKKAFRLVVTGELHGQIPAPAMAGGARSKMAPAAPKPTRIIDRTLPVREVPPYGFRPWHDPRKKPQG